LASAHICHVLGWTDRWRPTLNVAIH